MKEEYNLLQTYEVFLKLIYLKLLQEYWTYEWDLWNRLVKVVQYNAPDNGECVEVSYEYDALNHRISRTSGTETTKYAYGRNGALAYQEKTVDGNIKKRSFAYLNNEIIGFTDKTGEEESVYYTVTDIQRSITEVYDGSSNLVWKSGYTAFGELAGEIVDLIDFDGMYTGCDYDVETGLTYHWNRWRSEDGSCFISEDPARDGMNWYGYAGQNPMVYVDRIGLWIYNSDGTYTAQQGDTLWGLYGPSWQKKSGFSRDPSSLQIGETVGYANNTIISITNGPDKYKNRPETYDLQTYYIQKTELIGQSLDNVPQFFTSIGGGFSFGLGTIGGNATVSTVGYSNITTFNTTGDIGISVPGPYGSCMIGFNFPSNSGMQQNNFSVSIFGISGSLTVSENGITSIGLGFSTNVGINLNTGDMGINYNLFNGEFNVNSGEINISSQFMTGEQ